MKIYLLLFILFLITASCSKETKTPYSPPDNLKELIADDSLKVWKLAKRYNGTTRMNMGDCFLSYRQTFSNDGFVRDNNGDQPDCGSSLVGAWSIIKDSKGVTHIRITSDEIPKLMGITENYKDFKVFYASKDSLHLSFIHKQYGEQRKISDYLVREDIEVADRDFHFK